MQIIHNPYMGHFGATQSAFLGYEIVVPDNAKLPALGAGSTEAGVQEWSRGKFGAPIVGLVDAVLGNIGAKLGKTLTTLTTEDIKAFQSAHGLSDDGTIGKNTYAAMGIEGEMYSKPYVPSKSPVGNEIPDIGGAWYDNAYFIYGGASVVMGLVFWGTISYFRNK